MRSIARCASTVTAAALIAGCGTAPKSPESLVAAPAIAAPAIAAPVPVDGAEATDGGTRALMALALQCIIDATAEPRVAEAAREIAQESAPDIAPAEPECEVQEEIAAAPSPPAAPPPRAARPEVLEQVVADAINAIDQQRTATVAEVAAIVDSATNEAFGRAEQLVDKVFWRTLAVVGATAAAVLATMMMARPRRRRGHVSASVRSPGVHRPGPRQLAAGRA